MGNPGKLRSVRLTGFTIGMEYCTVVLAVIDVRLSAMHRVSHGSAIQLIAGVQ
jgi:hypothetical protein